MNDNELNALIKLLSDPDDFVSETARRKIINEFDEIQLKFNDAVKKSDDSSLIHRANSINSEYNFIKTKTDLINWKKSNDKSFVRGIFLISRFYNSNIKIEDIYNFLDNFKRKIDFDIKNLSPIEQVRVLNFLVFKEYNYKVNFQDERVEDYLYTGKTNLEKSPFAITFIYFILAKRLDIPLYMIYNRNIFLLAYFHNSPDIETQKFYFNKKINYRFFVNVPNKGYIFTNDEFKYTIEKHKIKSINEFIILTPNEFLKLLVGNLLYIERKKEDLTVFNYLMEFKKVLEQ